ncbi:MAG: NigD-like C-terminal domain-containing protein [Bacteroidales bacterium]|nr:hypothetical protein [Bacteroidales bacterium]
MKRLTFIFPLIFLMFATFPSCNLGDESDNTYNYLRMVTVVSGGDYPFFKTDVGEVLKCSNIVENDSGFNVGDRYYLSFSMVDTVAADAYIFPITYISSAKVKTRNFVTVEKDSADIYKNKQLGSAYNFFISGNYMNMIFYAYVPLTSKSTFELVRYKKNESNKSQDTIPTIYFELRHNTEETSSSPTLRLFSYELSPLTSDFPMATKFRIYLIWYSISGTQTCEFIYTPYDPNESLYSSIKKFAVPHISRTATGNIPYGL